MMKIFKQTMCYVCIFLTPSVSFSQVLQTQVIDKSGREVQILTAYGVDQEFVRKSSLNTYLSDKANAADVYTKTQTDTAISDAISNAGYLTSSDLDAYATTNDLNAKQNALTIEQLAATNSGITSADVTQIETNKTAIENLNTALGNKADVSTVDTLSQTVSTNETNIATNATNISALDTKVSTNETNIATNTSAIADNASNIATNATNISTLQASINSNESNLQKIESQVWSLSEDYKQLKRDFNTGMASMAAMTALVPNARASGDTQLSIGTGAYNGHTAIAVGGFHWVNNDVLLNAGIAWGNSQDAVYKAGVTLSW